VKKLLIHCFLVTYSATSRSFCTLSYVWFFLRMFLQRVDHVLAGGLGLTNPTNG